MAYLEFNIPFVFEDERGRRDVPRNMYVCINITERMERYSPDNWDTYPPSDEDACRELAQDLDENLDEFIRNGYIYDVSYDGNETIDSEDDLKRLEDELFFIY